MHVKKVVLGGTFDRFHAGHEIHLAAAFELNRPVTIGLTMPEMITYKDMAHIIEPYEMRERALQDYIRSRWPSIEVSIVPITDMFGPALKDTSFDTLVVTTDTEKNGRKLNDARIENGVPQLNMIVAPLKPALDGGALSSTRIRLGQIDRQGRPYNAIFGHSLTVPDEHRDALRHPIGETTGPSDDHTATALKAVALIETYNPTLIITVGDIVTSTLHQTGLYPNISFIDLKSDGAPLPNIPSPDYYDGVNPAGTIQKETAQLVENAIRESLKKMSSKVIIVDGEEDLLSLVAILLAPLNAVVIYGQKDHGIVINVVTEDLKAKVLHLTSLFK